MLEFFVLRLLILFISFYLVILVYRLLNGVFVSLSSYPYDLILVD